MSISVCSRVLDEKKSSFTHFCGAFVREARINAFAFRSRVLLLIADNDVPLDVALAALPFEEGAIKRATPFEYEEGVALMTCSAEDLIVLKAFAARDQDWLDVRGILVRQGKHLDLDYIYRELAPLSALKDAPEIPSRLKTLVEKVASEAP